MRAQSLVQGVYEINQNTRAGAIGVGNDFRFKYIGIPEYNIWMGIKPDRSFPIQKQGQYPDPVVHLKTGWLLGIDFLSAHACKPDETHPKEQYGCRFRRCIQTG